MSKVIKENVRMSTRIIDYTTKHSSHGGSNEVNLGLISNEKGKKMN